jgi:hypothetical protein
MAGEGEMLRLTGSFDDDVARARLEGLEGVRLHSVEGGRAVLSVAADGPGLTAILPRLLGSELGIRLTGRELRD